MILTIKVLLADDHLVVLKGITVFLDQEGFEIVGEAANGAEAVELAEQLKPDIVLMDIHMPHMDGIEACRAIIGKCPAAKVIFFTSSIEPALVTEALRAGASGYMLKHAEPEQLAEAIRGVHKGIIQLHPDLMPILLQKRNAAPEADDMTEAQAAYAIESLTRRESEVLELITQGLSNKDIAERLVVAEKTVKTHVSSILSKLHLTDRTQAALFAVRAGIYKQRQ